MPLRVIREVLDSTGGERTPEAEILERYDIPERALRRLAEVGVLDPDEGGYSPAEVRVIDAIARTSSSSCSSASPPSTRSVRRPSSTAAPGRSRT